MESSTNVVIPKIDEKCWVMQIKESLDDVRQQEEVEELRVSVFHVPKELLALKREAYIPQFVSIGPYHRWGCHLDDHMERYKLEAACRFQKRINRSKFETVVVEEFKKHDKQIRRCYHKLIEYKEETLAWFMALDAAFLLEHLQSYVRNADQSSCTDFKQLGRDLDLYGTISARNAIARDVMMLENQLPLFLLQKLLELQFEGSKANAEEMLRGLLRIVCHELSPFTFKLPEDSKLSIDKRGHLLEALYYSIVPVSSNQNPSLTEQEISDASDASDVSTFIHEFEPENDAPVASDVSTVSRLCFSLVWETLSAFKVGPARALNGRPLQVVKKLPFAARWKLPVLRSFKRRLAFTDNEDANKTKEEGAVEESSVQFIPPRRDELVIPSVADLCFAGVRFSVTDGDLTKIRFDKETATLYLPEIKLGTNTDVILRNLVAFEAYVAPGGLVFRRYIDFMNGMIDTEEDVRLLSKRGIISNHLQNNIEIANLFNSMGKCADLTKVAYLDKVIKDLNRYHKNRWKVVVVESANKFVFRSWKFLSLVAATILLLLTCLQTFCSVYDCMCYVSKCKKQEVNSCEHTDQ